MKKIIGIIISIVISLQLCVPAEAVTEQELNQKLYAKSALLMDAESGRVLYDKNGKVPMKNASTTKILTCIVALEQSEKQRVCTVSEYASTMPKVRLGVKAGQSFLLQDLLYSLMLESHNDSAVVIAENVAGSVEKFASLMNKKAKKIGAKQTNFVTPNGLDAEQHQTTAYDLALITRYALQNQQFVQIINTGSHSFTDISGKSRYSVYNKDAFLNLYEGAYGVKTGFTGGAGYCFVGASRKENHNLISVVLASGWPPHKSYKWQDTKQLMDFGRENFKWKKLFDGKEIVPLVKVSRGQQETVELECSSYEALVSDKDDIDITFHIPKAIEAPVKKKQKVGEILVTVNGVLEQKIPVRAEKMVREITFPFVFRKILNRYIFDYR